ncbi:hypothetical protein CK218_16675 [Mesorhizobium sp. WSM3879]|nr:hypothetical protein CK218_16675 [Mesorhizobium sp. WSM3879]
MTPVAPASAAEPVAPLSTAAPVAPVAPVVAVAPVAPGAQSAAAVEVAGLSGGSTRGAWEARRRLRSRVWMRSSACLRKARNSRCNCWRRSMDDVLY